MQLIVAYSIVLGGALLLRAFFKFLAFYISHFCAWSFLPWLTNSVYDKLQRLSMRYYHDKQTGELMSRAVNDARQMEMLFAHALPDLMSSILITILVTVVLFTINPPLAALTMIPIPLIIISSILFMKKVGPLISKNQKDLGSLNATLQDNISGMKEIQAFSQENKELGKVSEISVRYAKGVIRWSKVNSFFAPFIEFLTSIGTILVIAFGGYLAVHNRMSAADIVGFVLYLSLYYQPIATLARLTEDIQAARAGAKRVVEILDAFEEITDAPDAVEMTDCDGSVEFNNVSFHYLENQPILSDINFRAEKGQMIALVGPTGVGKTTLVSLLERFYDPIEGQALISGHDIKSVTVEIGRAHV
jgi:ABC-type multidrug transport system fused ATPase/permease subunit